MKIAIVTGNPLRYGGKGSYILGELGYFVGRGHEIVLIYWSDPRVYIPERHPSEEVCKKIRTIRFEPVHGGILRGPIYLLFNALYFSFFIRHLSKIAKISAIHAHDPAVAFGVSLAGMGKKTILHVHSPYQKDKFIIDAPLSNLKLKTRIRALVNHPFDMLLVLLVYNIVRHTLCLSEFEYDDVKSKTVTNKKVWIIRNGVDVSTFRPKETESPVKPSMLQGKFIALFVGRMVNKNGPMLIAEAARMLENLGDNKTLFVFAGDGPEKQPMREFIKRNDLKNILLLPWTPMKDVIHYADVFISHVSPMVEGHGLTIIEAMSSGIPVITGRDTIKEKLFKHKRDVFFIDKDDPLQIVDAIRTLQIDKELRHTISVNARKTVEDKFDNAKSMKLVEMLLFEYGHQR